MRLISISKHTSGQVQMPNDFYLNEMMSKQYTNEGITDHVGYYHRHIFTGGDFVDVELAIDKFMAYMRYHHGHNFVQLLRYDDKDFLGADYTEIFYAINGPLPAGARNNDWFGNMAKGRY